MAAGGAGSERVRTGFVFGLRRRLTLFFGLIISASVIAALATNIYIHYRLVEERLEDRASHLGDLVAEITRSYLFDMRIPELELIFEGIARQPDIDFIHVLDDEGTFFVSGSIDGAGETSFLRKVEDGLAERAMQTRKRQSSTEGTLEQIAQPVVLADEYYGTVRFAIRRDSFNKDLLLIWRRNIIVGIGLVLSGLLLSALVARRLSRPLSALTALTNQATKGDFNQTIALRTNDEFEDLAAAFNTMLQTVRESLAKVHAMAYRDNLTSLPNRAWFREYLDRTISFARAHHTRSALLFLDLDRFKQLNDTLGHHVGDQLLVDVAERLQHCLRSEDGGGWAAVDPVGRGTPQAAVSRLGGDEFTVVLPNLASRLDASVMAASIIDALAKPFDLGGEIYTASVSIGIAIYPDDGISPEDLLKQADIAMYQAKHAGRNTFRFYDHAIAARSMERLSLERELWVAIEQNQFEIHFQPQFSAMSRKVTGAEALIRWRHPEAGLLFPDAFLPVAAEARLLPAIGRCMISGSLALAREWAIFYERPLRVAVNISIEDLQSEGFAAWVIDELRKSGVDASTFELEITENAAMLDSDRVETQIRLLRSAGIRLAVDDFGMGYSNIARLKSLAFETLKIDRSLMQGIGTDREAEVLVGSILTMANALHLDVVAEGVESEAQLQFLQANGCPNIQGYLLGRPMPSDAFRDWLRREALDGIEMTTRTEEAIVKRTLG